MASLKQTTEVQLVPFNKSFLETIWKIGFSTDHPAWTKFNAPYFNDYRKFDDAKSFGASPIVICTPFTGQTSKGGIYYALLI